MIAKNKNVCENVFAWYARYLFGIIIKRCRINYCDNDDFLSIKTHRSLSTGGIYGRTTYFSYYSNL